MSRPEVTLILTAHREGLLTGVTARSLVAARRRAEAEGITCETLVILDNADAITADTLAEALGGRARFERVNTGDPSAARNHGTALAEGRFAAFLDGDDLWSENWIAAAVSQARRRPDAVAHPAGNVVFGAEHGLWWHVDSENPIFDPDYLRWHNYWDALSLAETRLYRAFPFIPNDPARGFGHEDWHWNLVTIEAGIAHKPVPRTLHFKRRRPGSVSARANARRAVPYPLEEGRNLRPAT